MTAQAVSRRGRDTWRRVQEWRWRQRQAGPKLIRAFAGAYPEAFLVEIGANDGDRYDHVHATILNSRWQALMVEPVPYVFARLEANYRDNDRVTLENCAIADHDGELPFYHLPPAGPEERKTLPDWYDAIGSFSREHVASHARVIPDIESRIITTKVPCMTFASLLAKHGREDADIVVTDTEGYDHEIVKQLDLRDHPPRLVIYEHYHFSPEQRASTRALFETAGYGTMEEGFDTFCLHRPGDSSLGRLWRRLRPGVPGLSVLDEPA